MEVGDRMAGYRLGGRFFRLRRSAHPDLWCHGPPFSLARRRSHVLRACDSFWSPDWAQDHVISWFLLFHLNQMNDFTDHPAYRRIILVFNGLMHAAQTQREHSFLLILGIPNRTANQRHTDGFFT